MKRVLIVDDEFLVRMGLKMTLDWKSYGYEIAAEASSAEEALEIMEHEPIDILMTDIKMQGMNGLDLIEKAKTKYADIQSVIFTNHDDFNFARRAMEMGAEKYILKSEISPDSLLSSLVNLSGESEGSHRMGHSVKKMEEKYLDEQLLKLKLSGVPENVSDNPYMNHMFCEESYMIIIGHCSINSLPDGSVSMLIETVMNLVSKFFCHSVARYIILKDLFCFGVIYHEERNEYPRELMEDRGASIIKNTVQYFNADINMGISRAGTKERFHQMFQEAETARLKGFFHNGNVWTYDETLKLPRGEHIRVSARKIKELVERAEKEPLAEYMDSIFRKLKDSGDYRMVTEVFIDLLSISKSLLENYDTRNIPGLNPLKFDYHNLYSMSHMNHVRMYAMDVYMAIWDFFHNRKSPYSGLIKECIGFIEENYSQNITLDNAAAAVNISSSYLSFIFKQETGINFSVYLTNYRIEMSKKLILKSNMKIYEIADQVGFGSPYYFSKVFKEIVGMTCKEFKNRI
ncbi:response regulator transcription factor [Lacrimispora saccharolytica]|uniref:Stage 0 sporulation protein A homolog n=1 Tax=Lacrimispora saccharolytica (strain ATCC 35040 / DSM 2544 / NRCC 2533 / WM1) TaxID=610130 RepID=D9R1C0_LACSW|nr:response regulator [Lacrimispora saccharolytica]ADL04667.1 two component transcriptional regulator, AraC family [[Clostridium] saccharolyticum WM1]QRV21102.1 response regulator [Lacrimispora saccharolytica]